MRITTYRPALAAAVALAGLALAAACGSAAPSGAANPPPGSGGASSPAGNSANQPISRPGQSTGPTASAPASGPAAGGSEPASPARCHTSQLAASFTSPDAGAGQRGALLRLTNTSGAVCSVYGYGGMQLLDAQKKPVPTNLVRVPTPPAQLVVLQPGQRTERQLYWSALPTEGVDAPSGPCQPQPAYAEVTPPDETDFLLISWPFGPVCHGGTVNGKVFLPAGQAG